MPVADECDSGELADEVLARVTLPDGWPLRVSTNCATPPLVVVSDGVADDRGESLGLYGARS